MTGPSIDPTPQCSFSLNSVILCMTTLAVVKAQKSVGVGGGVKGAVLWRSS
jgi:hypothetical protein